eukprot:TRINITY_DN719_c0_g1_i1.p1 TRINITY_DN719_c0_g1~~TRINITY_DN719_c0_g1_i1.p1  ORF type:complete len:207 (-),score=58.44 TRINITY_DN719_c0_g1_i1:31-606(-)
MGNSQSGRLTKDELEDLHKKTHFTQKELKDMYKQFKKETPQGVINKKEFKEVMKAMGVAEPFLQDLLFNVFDANKDGSINFQEFVSALSIMTRGTNDEKIEFAFQMYDFDGSKTITKEGMTQIMESFFKLVGPLVTFSGKQYHQPEVLVDGFFEEMDSNGDGKISLEEYKEGAVKNADIIQGLKLFRDEEH